MVKRLLASIIYNPSSKIHPNGYIAVILLVFVTVSIVITTAVVSIAIANIGTTTYQQRGYQALYVAESGVENAILRFLRDPEYTGESLVVGTGFTITTVTGTGPYIIRTVGTVGDVRRIIEVEVDRTSGILEILEWEEVYE